MEIETIAYQISKHIDCLLFQPFKKIDKHFYPFDGWYTSSFAYGFQTSSYRRYLQVIEAPYLFSYQLTMSLNLLFFASQKYKSLQKHLHNSHVHHFT
jgi:hypothetical protein